MNTQPTGRSVLLVVHVARDEATKLAAEFAADLRSEGLEVSVLETEDAQLRAAGLDQTHAVPATPGAAHGCELAVVFGGDGTILRAAEMCRGTSTPVLGVNLGHVGFLAEADAEDIHEVVRGVVDRSYTVEKAARERMLELVVEIDDRPVSRWGCDGIVCATPTGSTAYNFSAGGPIVWPEVSALLLVPISAHALFARPLVVSPNSTLAIEVVGDRSTGVLWCDGRRAADLPLGARVEVRHGHEPVRLARLKPGSFADRLVRKFDLPVAGWRGAAERRQQGDA